MRLMGNPNNDLKEEQVRINLQKQITEYNRNNMKEHQSKGILYVVDQDLNLSRVGSEMFLGDSRQIEEHINDGLLFPPSKEEIELWSRNDHIHFNSLTIQPYILIQKK